MFSRPFAHSMLSEAARCESSPEIGTPVRINPARRAVIKHPGVFRCTLTGGEKQERRKTKEEKRQ